MEILVGNPHVVQQQREGILMILRRDFPADKVEKFEREFDEALAAKPAKVFVFNDRSALMMRREKLLADGLSPEELERCCARLARPYGICIITIPRKLRLVETL